MSKKKSTVENQMEETTYAKRDLIKTNSKSRKKKNLIGELTFVEPHVDTFYVGMNDNWKSNAFNPMQAKLLNVDDENTTEIAKNWVDPDAKLLKCRKKTVNASVKTNRAMKKRCPLEFVDDDKTPSKTRPIRFENNQEDFNQPTSPNSLLKKVANDMMNETEVGKQTPVRPKVLANDTPVEYYGASIFERRRLGI